MMMATEIRSSPSIPTIRLPWPGYSRRSCTPPTSTSSNSASHEACPRILIRVDTVSPRQQPPTPRSLSSSKKSLHDLACKAKMNDLFELAKWSFTVLLGLKCSRRGLTANLTELLEPDM